MEEWRGARDALEEVRSKEEWEKGAVKCKEVEDAIFALTGQRPPYATGWGVDLSRG